MDPLSALIVGGLGLAGSAFSNSESRKQARDQENFQREMSNTSHSREVADLKKAGLNPILSALGSGASTPTGAQGSVADYGQAISKGADTGLAVKALNKEMDLKDQTIWTGRKEEVLKKHQADLTAKEATLKEDQIHGQRLLNRQTQQMMPHLIKKAKATGDWSQVNELMGVIKAGTSSAADVTDMINPIKIKIPKGK